MINKSKIKYQKAKTFLQKAKNFATRESLNSRVRPSKLNLQKVGKI